MTTEVLSEKVSVNINSSTLSGIDLLVDNGYYSNRSDFINHALRTALQQQQSTLDRLIDQNKEKYPNQWFVGVTAFSSKDIDALYDIGTPIDITAYGVMSISEDVDEEKLFSAVRSIRIKGKLFCSPSIKAHYGITAKSR